MRRFLLILTAACASPPRGPAPGPSPFQPVETTIADLQARYRSGSLTPRDVVAMYLARIAAYDGRLHAYLHVNGRALEDASHLDSKAPLYGIPVILKDNIATSDMPTTAGSVALGRSQPKNDATIAVRLRQAGAVILGKGTLTEFANFLTTGMPTGYSSKAGYGFNPYDPRADPRPRPLDDGRPALAAGGSSSGPAIAVAANLATVGVGTETSGSILNPASQNMLVGIKPTVGLVSRYGIVPITADQDTAGPMARTVTDAAKLLGVLAGFDGKDPATRACLTKGNCFDDYTRFLDAGALKGARIAVPHFGYWTTKDGAVQLSPSQQRVMDDAIHVLRDQGAEVTDFDIPDQADLLAHPGCTTLPLTPACSTVLLFGFKRDLNAYLANFAPGVSDTGTAVATLADVIAYNDRVSALKYGQAIALAAQSLDTSPGSPDTTRYLADRASDLDLSRKRGLDTVFARFDAVLFPANFGANIAARAGYPSVIVPGGTVENPSVPPPPQTPPPAFPAGFDARPAPFGITFSGPAFSEPKLIGYAYAFEQATRYRMPPASTP
jgi:amidase